LLRCYCFFSTWKQRCEVFSAILPRRNDFVFSAHVRILVFKTYMNFATKVRLYNVICIKKFLVGTQSHFYVVVSLRTQSHFYVVVSLRTQSHFYVVVSLRTQSHFYVVVSLRKLRNVVSTCVPTRNFLIHITLYNLTFVAKFM
jgi:hypothetical protein